MFISHSISPTNFGRLQSSTSVLLQSQINRSSDTPSRPAYTTYTPCKSSVALRPLPHLHIPPRSRSHQSRMCLFCDRTPQCSHTAPRTGARSNGTRRTRPWYRPHTSSLITEVQPPSPHGRSGCNRPSPFRSIRCSPSRTARSTRTPPYPGTGWGTRASRPDGTH